MVELDLFFFAKFASTLLLLGGFHTRWECQVFLSHFYEVTKEFGQTPNSRYPLYPHSNEISCVFDVETTKKTITHNYNFLTTKEIIRFRESEN